MHKYLKGESTKEEQIFIENYYNLFQNEPDVLDALNVEEKKELKNNLKDAIWSDIEKNELSHFFPEMRALLNQCRFNSCRHINEPGCAVITAVEEGEIELSRYESYLSIYHGNDTRA